MWYIIPMDQIYFKPISVVRDHEYDGFFYRFTTTNHGTSVKRVPTSNQHWESIFVCEVFSCSRHSFILEYNVGETDKLHFSSFRKALFILTEYFRDI